MHRHTIAVIGTGYVGLTAGACLAQLGHRVVCADLDPVKVAELNRGDVRILEEGLPELVRAGLDAGRLRFVIGAADAVRGARTVFICVGTPTGPDGRADLTAVDAVVEEIRPLLEPDSVLVTKSTVPVGTAARITAALGRTDVGVVSNPEFLREGTSVSDFLQPDRVVIGSASPWAAAQVAELYAGVDAPVVLADAASAEVVKYAANCFLAVKLSYVNTLAELCEQVGADIGRVTAALGQDHRVGGAFLRPGPGWGGSCLPKDTRALLGTADSFGIDFPLVRAAIDTNAHQQTRIAAKISRLCGGTDGSLAGVRIGLLGLTFKAGTDDLRDSPALAIATELARRGAELTAHDPAVPVIRHAELPAGITVVDDPHQAANGASGLVLCTEWPHYRGLDWTRVAAGLHRPVVVDTRNHLDPRALSAAGLAWHGTGTSPVEPALTPV
ncbi:UDP-glucose/GDP-mannose dehydrogenase family protein [Streptomyces spongiae]|uniref:UDP-glucose 6-dehydrogenase n=1 Tax=Streptomyces spongiae TaxID=565072 RepID=A0A5N8XSJ3_9ACTN|nr:UDP-glucose/GDP-mannose dehydrogenase family protein [Streptomyces spongiae]